MQHVVFVRSADADVEDIRCMALAAVWGALACGKRSHDVVPLGDETAVYFENYGAAITFSMKCATAGIKFRGPASENSN
jgi:hypothetical protein